jgi:hypothetical protein
MESWDGTEKAARAAPRHGERASVGILGRGRKKPATAVRPASRDDLGHLSRFVSSRSGVEAYLEPRTAVTETTVVLVAATGEWTRRRVDGPDGARSFAHKHAIPLYDVGVVGYPRRMREWNQRSKGGGSEPGTSPPS